MSTRDLPERLIRLGDEQTAFIILSTGFTTDGLPYYAYVRMKPSKYLEYLDAVKSGAPFTLGSFGEILAKGFGHQPPDEVVQRMADEFGLTEENQKAIEAFAESLLQAELQKQSGTNNG